MATHRHLDAAGLENLVLLNGHRAQKRLLLEALGHCPECARADEHLLTAREAAGVKLVARVTSFLDRARHDPGLRFEAERGERA